MVQLRPYQLDAIERLRQGIRAAHLSQVLQMATGSGKTATASAIIKSSVAKGKVCYFIVDSLELIDQACEAFGRDGLEDHIGVKQGNHYLTDDSRMVQVCTIQTLRARWDNIPDHRRPGLIIIDECHVFHDAHRIVVEWAAENRVPVIGLSATPFRKGMATHFSNLVVGATNRFLTENGFLKPAICYAPSVPDLSKVELKGGKDSDWKEESLAEVMQGELLMGDLVEHWLRLGAGRQTIAFACNVAHSRAIAAKFQKAGIRAAHVDGYMKEEERCAIIESYKSGKIQLLSNVAVLTKGFDAPETSCLIIARPTKSLMLHIQMLGRGLRVGGHPDCVVLDHAGNCIRNGLPCDDLPEELDDGKSTTAPDRKTTKAEKVPKPCVACGVLITGLNCYSCFAKQPLPKLDVEVVNGTLQPVGKSDAKPKTYSPAEKADIYGQFLAYARMHGKKDGWAYYACKDYCGSTPMDKSQRPLKISPEIHNWIKARNIAFAKRKTA